MNPGLARLQAAIVKNKVPIGVLGAGAVAALAWRSRSTSTSPATDTASSGAVSTTPYYSAGGQTAGASGYDSTASDVYNAIQPQLEDLQNLFEQYRQSPIPVPGQAPGTAASVTGYFRPKGSPAVFQALSDGTKRLVDLPEYIALGKPKETELPANDAFFKRPSA